MTRPTDCPNCEIPAFRNGSCSHCGFEEPRLPPWREQGLAKARKIRSDLRVKRGVTKSEESE
jgi:ribosomal protein L37E